MLIDAMGKACPIPVVLAKKELDGGCRDLTVAVDNEAAVGNLTRLAARCGLQAESVTVEGGYHVRLFGAADAAIPISVPTLAPANADCGCGYAVFISRNTVGSGDDTLGYNLLKMALYTLAQSDDVPASVLFMNGGVKLPAGEEAQVIESLEQLIEKGTEVLVCGTCLNYFGLTEQLKVGTVSNMYDILGHMQSAAKVITL